MEMINRLVVAALLVTSAGLLHGAAAQSPAAGEHWIATWGTAQQLYRIPAGGGGPARSGAPSAAAAAGPAPAAAPATQATPAPGTPQRRFGIPPALPGLNNQTVRMILRVSVGGHRLRVRLFNALGSSTVTFGAAHVAIRGSGATIVPGSDRLLTFSGKPSPVLYAGQVLVSDPVSLDVAPLTDLSVSLYVPSETTAPTSHTFGLRPTYISKEGDLSGAANIPELSGTTQSYYWLSGVDVLAPASAGTVVTFGDS